MRAPFPIPRRKEGLSIETQRSCDFRSCEQMRDSGMRELEIKLFMGYHDGYYDKDHKTKSKGKITFPTEKKRWFNFFK